MAIDAARSEAVLLLLGRGTSPYPQRDPQRVVDRFGESEGLDLIQYIEQVLDELYAVAPDWTNDLQAVTARAVEVVRQQHAELSDEALAALGWSYSWDWK
jgi:hypothetical protein